MLACAGAFVVANVTATQWMNPQRQLTSEEWLQYDISGADAICVGYVMAVHDTLVDIAPDGGGIPSTSIRVAVKRWLKGHAREQQLDVGVSPFDPEPVHGSRLSSLAGGPQAVVLMLRRSPDGWGLCSGPDPSGAGIRLLSNQSDGEFEKKLKRLI